MAKKVTRSQLNKLLGTGGMILTVILLVVAGLTYLGYNFATTQVHDQLAQERISFPDEGSPALDPEKYPGLQQYAGEPVDNGVKAKAYADEYIWIHMMDSSDGMTYAEASTAAQQDPGNEELAETVDSLFRGNMLRSSLLTAYAFSVFGAIAGYAVIASLVGAVAVFLLSARSLAKARRN